MQTASLVSLLTVITLALSAAPDHRVSSHLDSLEATPGCPNSLPHEPLVLYEVTGGTLLGPVDGFLAVYGDGLARYSSSIDGSGPGSSQTVFVGTDATLLQQDLIAAGAMSQCDQPDIANDVPQSTLTVFRANARRASTFSWFLPEGPTEEIQSILSSFIAAHFTLPPSGGGS